MGGFLGIGKSGAQSTDRKTELTGFGNLNNVFNYAMPTGQNLTNSGGGDLSSASGYYKGILSGNRAKTMATIAPQTAAINANADAARKTAATSGTARGGGTNSQNATSADTTRSTIDNAVLAAPGAAAGELAKTGTAELSAGENALGLGASASADMSKIATDQYKNDLGANSQMTSGIETALTAIFG